MNIKKTVFTLPEAAAVGTWAIVFGICLYWLPHASPDIKADTPYIVAFFIVYLACFLTLVRQDRLRDRPVFCVSVLVIQLLSAFLIMWLLPMDFLPILTIVWVSMLPHFTSLRKSFLIMLVVIIAWFWLDTIFWDKKDGFFRALLYATFHFFAVFMNYHTRVAEDASLQAQELNKELQATQHLLTEASRQNERTRIARDLHDLLGHHLTALIINLQVVSRLSDGEAKNKIEQCHSLAKLLLSDVRDAVSTLRENQELDFQKMVELLIVNTPKLKIHSKVDNNFNLEDLDLAKALLSCIQEALTNSLRHSGATEFWLNLTSDQQQLQLTMYDDGQVRQQFKPGNGLKGMRERVESFQGQLELQRYRQGLKLQISIPKQSLKQEQSNGH